MRRLLRSGWNDFQRGRGDLTAARRLASGAEPDNKERHEDSDHHARHQAAKIARRHERRIPSSLGLDRGLEKRKPPRSGL